ncbi:MAG: SAM-dependent methyltransferase [Prochlorothrix sp.]
MENTPVTGVSDTARSMAAIRAVESERADALFVDPFAAQLAGAEAVAAARPIVEQYEQQGRPYGQVRTRFLDDFILKHRSSYTQLVLLGSGLDSRAFRLKLPPTMVCYELDQQVMIDYKVQMLAEAVPTCCWRPQSADLGESRWGEILQAAGFQPEQPTIWVLEGFLYYLLPEQARDLMRVLNTLSAIGSVLGCDLINDVACNGTEAWATMWHFGCNDPEAFLAEYGWVAQSVQPNDPEAAYDRFTFPLAPRDQPEAVHLFFTTALKTA